MALVDMKELRAKLEEAQIVFDELEKITVDDLWEEGEDDICAPRSAFNLTDALYALKGEVRAALFDLDALEEDLAEKELGAFNAE